MFSTCLFCHSDLGRNERIDVFPVGRKLAFDPARGRLWVVCVACGRWNLSPLEERWEAIEVCERLFRATPLRASTDHIGLAQLPDGLSLVRIGPPAERREIAAWRYGRRLLERARTDGQRVGVRRLVGHAAHDARDFVNESVRRGLNQVARGVAFFFPAAQLRYDTLTWMRIRRMRHRVLDVIDSADLATGERLVVRYHHLDTTELVRPNRLEPWRLQLRHEHGVTTLAGDAGLRTAGKMLAALNGRGATSAEVQYALAKLEDAGNPDGYFARVAALALRTAWGKDPDAPRTLPTAPEQASLAERLALHITNRSFLGRGGIGSEPATALPLLPLVDRLALEMAANEDAERRALEGELTELEAAWRDAEEIAAIADSLFERVITASRQHVVTLIASSRLHATHPMTR